MQYNKELLKANYIAQFKNPYSCLSRLARGLALWPYLDFQPKTIGLSGYNMNIYVDNGNIQFIDIDEQIESKNETREIFDLFDEVDYSRTYLIETVKVNKKTIIFDLEYCSLEFRNGEFVFETIQAVSDFKAVYKVNSGRFNAINMDRVGLEIFYRDRMKTGNGLYIPWTISDEDREKLYQLKWPSTLTEKQQLIKKALYEKIDNFPRCSDMQQLNILLSLMDMGQFAKK